MEVTYELDKKDIVAFQRHFYRTSPVLRRVRNFWLLLFGALFAYDFFTSRDDLLTSAVFVLAGAAIILLLFTAGVELMNSYITRSLLAKGRENGVTGRHRVSLTPEKFVETTSVNETHTLWLGVARVEQNDGYVYVFITPQTAVIVPKRAFLDGRQAAEFYEAAVSFRERAQQRGPGAARPAAEIERAASLAGRPARQFDESHLSPVERMFNE